MANYFEDIIKKPIISEKTMALTEEGKYTFEVSKDANKIEIKNAVENLFKVSVTKVNTILGTKKKKRVGKHSGFKPIVRKAIVTLKKGDKINAFEA